MELNHKPYLGAEGEDETEYIHILEENGLYPEWTYDKDMMEKNLLKAVIAVLEIVSNDIDKYMRIETEFISQNAALDNLHKRIEHLHNRIGYIESSENASEQNDISFFFIG
jgi:hypothetical protein